MPAAFSLGKKREKTRKIGHGGGLSVCLSVAVTGCGGKKVQSCDFEFLIHALALRDHHTQKHTHTFPLYFYNKSTLMGLYILSFSLVFFEVFERLTVAAFPGHISQEVALGFSGSLFSFFEFFLND